MAAAAAAAGAGVAEVAEVAEGDGIYTQDTVLMTNFINDSRLHKINTDVKKDHDKTYNLEVVQEIVARNVYTGELKKALEKVGDPGKERTGRGGPLQEAVKQDKNGIVNACMIIPASEGEEPTILSNETYNLINTVTFNDGMKIQINGTPFRYTVHKVNRANWNTLYEINKIANIMGKSFIKYTDVHRGGVELLHAWPDQGAGDANTVRLLQIINRQIELDPASKFNPTSGNGVYKNKFYIEDTSLGKAPQFFTFPKYIDTGDINQQTAFLPESHGYLGYDYLIQVENRKEGKLEVKSHIIMKDGEVALVPKAANIAGALTNIIKKAANLKTKKKIAGVDKNYIITYISKHMGDTGQLLSCFIDQPLIPVNVPAGEEPRPSINSLDPAYSRVFETYDTIPCMKALEEGVNVWYYPTSEPEGEKNMIIFKLEEDIDENIRYETVRKYMLEEYDNFIREHTAATNKYTTLKTDRDIFKNKSIELINGIGGEGEDEDITYKKILKVCVQIAALSSFYPSYKQSADLPEIEEADKNINAITSKDELVAFQNFIKTEADDTEGIKTKINRMINYVTNIKNKAKEKFKLPSKYLNRSIFNPADSNNLYSVSIENILQTTVAPPEAESTVKKVTTKYATIFKQIDLTKSKVANIEEQITGRYATRFSNYWGLDVLNYIYTTFDGFSDELKNAFITKLNTVIISEGKKALLRKAFELLNISEEVQGGGGKNKNKYKYKKSRKQRGAGNLENLKPGVNTTRRNSNNVNEDPTQLNVNTTERVLNNGSGNPERNYEAEMKEELDFLQYILEDLDIFYDYTIKLSLAKEKDFMPIYAEFIEKMYGPRETSSSSVKEGGGELRKQIGGAGEYSFVEYPEREPANLTEANIDDDINADVDGEFDDYSRSGTDRPVVGGVKKDNVLQLFDSFYYNRLYIQYAQKKLEAVEISATTEDFKQLIINLKRLLDILKSKEQAAIGVAAGGGGGREEDPEEKPELERFFDLEFFKDQIEEKIEEYGKAYSFADHKIKPTIIKLLKEVANAYQMIYFDDAKGPSIVTDNMLSSLISKNFPSESGKRDISISKKNFEIYKTYTSIGGDIHIYKFSFPKNLTLHILNTQPGAILKTWNNYSGGFRKTRKQSSKRINKKRKTFKRR